MSSTILTDFIALYATAVDSALFWKEKMFYFITLFHTVIVISYQANPHNDIPSV